MIIRNIGGREFTFNNTLRVMYNLKTAFGVDTFQDTLERLRKASFDDQLLVVFESYRSVPGNLMTKEEFFDFVIDSMGIIAITSLSGAVIDGLLYTGATPAERGESEKNADKLPETLE